VQRKRRRTIFRELLAGGRRSHAGVQIAAKAAAGGEIPRWRSTSPAPTRTATSLAFPDLSRNLNPTATPGADPHAIVWQGMKG
jgi:hypothetical protein